MAGLLASDHFRVYTNPDVVGVELCGALKNVVALAAGMVDGLGFGDSAKAGIITRGLAEMTRLGVAAGAHPLTFAGLAGVGDLIATCMSPLSRNRRAGELMGSGLSWTDASAQINGVAEGVSTVRGALDLAAQHGVELPIAEQVAAVVHDGRPPMEAVAEPDGARAQGRAGRDAGMSGLRVRVSLGVASLLSLVTGAILLAIGSVFRQRPHGGGRQAAFPRHRRSSGAGSRTTRSGSATPMSWRSGSVNRHRRVPWCAWPRPPNGWASACRRCAAACSAASCRPSWRAAA